MKLSEAEVQRVVTDALKACGWRYYHSRPAQAKGGRWLTPYEGSDGWPDIVAIKGSTLLVLECKGTTGARKPGPGVRSPNAITKRLRYEAQEAWLDAFRDAGARAGFVTPENLDDVLEIIAEEGH